MLKKKLMLFLDEIQLLAQQPGFAAKTPLLRHAGISLWFNAQNPSLLSAELLGNLDLFCVFQLSDGRDREMAARVLGLNEEQRQSLGRLREGECILYLPRSGWPHPFLSQTVQIEFENPPYDLLDRGREFLRDFPWTPLDQASIQKPKSASESQTSAGEKFDADTRNFLSDVLNQMHEFSAMTPRFERAGIRSAARQKQILDAMIQRGFIQTHPLSIGRGRPILLGEAMEKTFAIFKIEPWVKGRGILPTRAAQEFVFQKMKRLGWKCEKEGMLKNESNSKAVDVLCRDPEGKVVTIEIAGSAGHEVHNAAFCVKNSNVRKHVVAAVTKQILDEVKRKFEGFPELKENPNVEILLLSQVLSEKWVP